MGSVSPLLGNAPPMRMMAATYMIPAVTTPGASPIRTRKGTPRNFRKATVRTRPSRRTTSGASSARGGAPADAEEVNALVGPALLDHEWWADDGVATLEQALNGGEREQRRGLSHDDERGRSHDVAGVRDQEHAAAPEEIRQDAGGRDPAALGGPVD